METLARDLLALYASRRANCKRTEMYKGEYDSNFIAKVKGAALENAWHCGFSVAWSGPLFRHKLINDVFSSSYSMLWLLEANGRLLPSSARRCGIYCSLVLTSLLLLLYFTRAAPSAWFLYGENFSVRSLLISHFLLVAVVARGYLVGSHIDHLLFSHCFNE